MSSKSYMAKKGAVERKWLIVDAQGKILGRLATRIALALMGKNKPTYTPHIDTGDFVIVVNAEKIAVTGRKMTDKVYSRNTLYPGGLRQITLEKLLQTKPTDVIRLAVKRMLPKTALAKHMITKLKVYAGPDHPHAAQQPEPMKL